MSINTEAQKKDDTMLKDATLSLPTIDSLPAPFLLARLLASVGRTSSLLGSFPPSDIEQTESLREGSQAGQ